MRVAEGSRRLLTSLARRAGHTSMGIELAAGTEQYHLPYLLSTLRDKAQAAYDRDRERLMPVRGTSVARHQKYQIVMEQADREFEGERIWCAWDECDQYGYAQSPVRGERGEAGVPAEAGPVPVLLGGAPVHVRAQPYPRPVREASRCGEPPLHVALLNFRSAWGMLAPRVWSTMLEW